MESVFELNRSIEDEIARETVAGDSSRLGELLSLMKRVIVSSLISSGVHTSELEDMVQSVSIRIIEKIHTWRGEGRIGSWIYAVARSVARSHCVRKKEITLEPETAVFLADSRSSTRLIEDMDWEARRREFLRSAVMELPEDMREVVSLFYYGSMKGEEISAVLDIPLNTVKSRLLRARKALIEHAEESGWYVIGANTNV
jgi:RNA polymerase sigma-70 factor, ECF subfamily